jgi:preprotein translocase subunit SecE
MAKRSKRGLTGADGFESAAAIAESEREVSKAEANSGGGARRREDRKPPGTGPRPTGGGSRRGLFDVYKPGQGFHTRVWSGVGAGALVLWFAYFLYEKLGAMATDQSTARLWQVGTWVAVIVVFGLLGYWLLALNRKVGDFLIATEGEMKKVNWSSRKDIIGSTKVVVIMVLFMGSLLFMVDLFFMAFFNSIGVLKGAGFLESLQDLF